MKRFMILLLGMAAVLPAFAQGYKGVVENFYNALGNRDFPSAYQLCTGKNWGSLAQFSSARMYGGIYDVAFSKCEYQKSDLPNTVEVLVDIFVRDSVNGDGRFVQQFYLVPVAGNWRIRRIALLQTDRAEKGWNLKLTEQPGLSETDINKLLQPVYDTASRLSNDGEPVDKLDRTVNKPRFFQTPEGVYAVVVVQNGCDDCGIAFIGWCDVFVLKQERGRWLTTDVRLRAGGGGMYGNPGIAEKPLLRAGAAIVGLVLTGGQVHMGELYSFDDVLAIENGKVSSLVSISTHYDNENAGRGPASRCGDIGYHFLASDKPHYDLQLTFTNCLGKGKEMGKKVVVYSNKEYKIPDDYTFEM